MTPEIAHLHQLAARGDRLRQAHEMAKQAQAEIGRVLAREDDKNRYSLARVLNSMSGMGGGGLRVGVEAEVAQEMARAAGVHYDMNRPHVPWEVVSQRTLTVSTSTQGGFLVDTQVSDISLALRPWSIAARAGISVLPGLSSNLQIPRQGSTGTGYWLATESTQITESNPTLSAGVMLTPHNAGAYLEASRLLLKQGTPIVDRLIGSELSRTVGALVDTAIITGTGTSLPVGILNTAGIVTTTGTSATYAMLLHEQEQLALANVDDQAIAWIGAPSTRETLAQRDLSTASGKFIWENDKIVARPAYVSSVVPAGKLIGADWRFVVLGLFGPGLQLEMNPYANFPAGVVGFRVLVTCDVGLLQPSAVRVLTGVT